MNIHVKSLYTAIVCIILLGNIFMAKAINIEELNNFNASHYNKLLSVEEADVLLKENGKLHEFLDRVKSVVNEVPNLSNYFGFRLIHKHHILPEDTVVVEKFVEEKAPAFVTSPQLLTEKGAYPASWILNKGKYEAFEYSTDPAVKEGFSFLVQSLSVLETIRSLSEEYKLQYILAPALMARSNLAHINQDGKIWIENTYIKPEWCCVVKAFDSASVDHSKVIKTSWSLNPSIITWGCSGGVCCWPENGEHEIKFWHNFDGSNSISDEQ